jgi:hypothetical protein
VIKGKPYYADNDLGTGIRADIATLRAIEIDITRIHRKCRKIEFGNLDVSALATFAAEIHKAIQYRAGVLEEPK